MKQTEAGNEIMKLEQSVCVCTCVHICVCACVLVCASHLAECWFIVLTGTSISMATSSNFEVEGTVHPAKRKSRQVILLL